MQTLLWSYCTKHHQICTQCYHIGSNREPILDHLIVPNLTSPQEYLFSKEYIIFNYQN